jgi:hypothetical protein
MEQGEQQEQDARDEERAAGQENTQQGEHGASEQEDGPPVGPHDASGPRHHPGAGRRLRAGIGGRVTDVVGHPGSLLRTGEPSGCAGNVLVPCLQDNCLTATGQEQVSPAFWNECPGKGMAQGRQRVRATPGGGSIAAGIIFGPLIFAAGVMTLKNTRGGKAWWGLSAKEKGMAMPGLIAGGFLGMCIIPILLFCVAMMKMSTDAWRG